MRRPQAHLDTITTEDGATSVQFLGNDPDALYAIQATVKPGNTIHKPPYHWHKYQIETFFINSGTFRVTLDGDQTDIPAGSTVTVEPGVHHTFANASETEPMVISVGLDPLERERDEAFFRNLYGYLDDCRVEGMTPNLAQMCLFLHFFDCYMALPGPKVIMHPLSELLVFILGVVVGKWMLGLRESYPEYYKEKPRKIIVSGQAPLDRWRSFAITAKMPRAFVLGFGGGLLAGLYSNGFSMYKAVS